MLKKNKKLLFISAMLLLVLILLFIIGEGGTRIIVGKRLIPEIREDGFYYFKPNQEGWYSHSLAMPPARINNIGARGEDVDINLLSANEDYIFLGDSFTFGYGVKEDKTIPAFFMNEIGKNVLNYGNGGYGIDHIIEMYKLHSDLFKKKDVIIFTAIEDDFYRQLDPSLHKKAFINKIFWEVKEKSSFISWVWANYNHVKGLFERSANIEVVERGDPFEKQGDDLISLKKELDKKSIGLIYLAYEYNYSNYSKYARYFCQENNILCITDIPDSVEIIKKKNEPIYCIDNGHPSAELNEEVAKRIAKFINNTYSLGKR